MNRAEAQSWAYAEIDRIYPPLTGSSAPGTEPAVLEDPGVTGLSELPRAGENCPPTPRCRSRSPGCPRTAASPKWNWRRSVAGTQPGTQLLSIVLVGDFDLVSSQVCRHQREGHSRPGQRSGVRQTREDGHRGDSRHPGRNVGAWRPLEVLPEVGTSLESVLPNFGKTPLQRSPASDQSVSGLSDLPSNWPELPANALWNNEA